MRSTHRKKSRFFFRQDFKRYLHAVSKPELPGGGSVMGVVFCLGVSLLQMAISFSNKFQREKLLDDVLVKLVEIKKKMFPYIDRDSEIFQAVLQEKSIIKKKKLIQSLNRITFDLGQNCNRILLLSQRVGDKIKDTMRSDFYIGLRLIEVVVEGCLVNLEVNRKFLKEEEREEERILQKYLDDFREWLRCWREN